MPNSTVPANEEEANAESAAAIRYFFIFLFFSVDERAHLSHKREGKAYSV
jgi:hypothetical protein